MQRNPYTRIRTTLAAAIAFAAVLIVRGQHTGASAGRELSPPQPHHSPSAGAHVLQANDFVAVSVYQEDDMSARVRLEKDGTIQLPLLGRVHVGGKTLEEAACFIRDLLAKDYLVRPQVTITILEFAKRRFTVLGQVQRPGSYEMPGGEEINLLQAIAMAGGYTRLGAPGKVVVQRRIGQETRTFKLDADAMSKNNVVPFEIHHDDTITVGERLI